MADLKPCPFCGATEDDRVPITNGTTAPIGIMETQAPEHYWWARCKPCGIRFAGRPTEAEATEAWNRRAGDLLRQPGTTIQINGVNLRASAGATLNLGGNGYPSGITATFKCPTELELSALLSIGNLDKFIAVYLPDSGACYAIEEAELACPIEVDGNEMTVSISGKDPAVLL